MLFVAATAIAIATVVTIYRQWPPAPIHATSRDPLVAVRQEMVVLGVRWGMSYEGAFEQARAKRSPVLIYFAAVNDSSSRFMDTHVLPRPEVRSMLSQFVTVLLRDDIVPISSLSVPLRQKVAEANIEHHIKLSGRPITPTFVALATQGDVLAIAEGNKRPEEFVEFLGRALGEFQRRSNRPPTPSSAIRR
jgi:hypothetical protein